MTTLAAAVEDVVKAQTNAKRPLAVVVAGHNGSGKSTMWRMRLADRLRIPLINADRMMLSILPEPGTGGKLVAWAAQLRDSDRGWIGVAQKGVEAFVAQAMGAKVSFGMETVFSYWERQTDGTIASKIDLIRDMQKAGYFVLLFFVGLTDADTSILRVATRVAQGGHAIDEPTLRKRFPKTQTAIREAVSVADASVLVDNSRDTSQAFTVCRIQLGAKEAYDIRNQTAKSPAAILKWMDIVAPR